MRQTILLLPVLTLLLLFGGCKMLFRSIRYNVPSVHDHRFWDARRIERAGPVYPFVHSDAGLPPIESWAFGKDYKAGMSPEEFFESTGTVAFLVLRGDTLLYEHYFHGNADTTSFNGFSMGKAYLSALLGIAIDEGYIGGLDQSVGDYLPWCTDSVMCGLKLRHLLQMTSGIASNEGYLNPWSTSTKLYYGDQMWKQVHGFEFKRAPGEKFFYQNINSQLLGMVIAQATGRSLGAYLQEKIWQPLGMESDASWSLHEGTDVEKAFCCLNARARDFARFGLLYLREGNWQGKQIVPAAWAKLPLAMDTTEGASMHYQYAWYTNMAREEFYAQGLLGQFTYICPSTNTVIVRLGNNLEFNVPWYDIFRFIGGASTLPKETKLPKERLAQLEGTWDFGLSRSGDKSMAGKSVVIKAKGNALLVKSSFQKTWVALPSSEVDFYNLEFGRYLHVSPDSAGKFTQMNWKRRGLVWDMKLRGAE